MHKCSKVSVTDIVRNPASVFCTHNFIPSVIRNDSNDPSLKQPLLANSVVAGMIRSCGNFLQS